MMTFSERLEAAYDFWRPNRRGLKPYLIKDGKEHPFAVIVPGGAYRMVCSYVEGLPFAKALNEKGYHAIVAYYRIGKKAKYPAPQDDLEHAILQIFAHAADWNLDTKNVYPVITLGEGTHAESRQNLLGRDPDPALLDRLSVEKHITGDFPPTYVWNGTADASVDPCNSRMLAEALGKAGVLYRHEEFEGVGHGVGLAKSTNAEPWFDHAVSFWEEQK